MQGFEIGAYYPPHTRKRQRAQHVDPAPISFGNSARRIQTAWRRHRLAETMRSYAGAALPGVPEPRTRAQVANRLRAIAVMERRMGQPGKTSADNYPEPEVTPNQVWIAQLARQHSAEMARQGDMSPTSAWIAEANASQRSARRRGRKRKGGAPMSLTSASIAEAGALQRRAKRGRKRKRMQKGSRGRRRH
ncbi:hypothetical protein WJX74_004760 [Apatococcus lobatus]|uniref:Uncharacterized protein n=1 Tax=Apatococcus lobatus TaxID=904363 RepID=A0AAW1R0F8_9CHLO